MLLLPKEKRLFLGRWVSPGASLERAVLGELLVTRSAIKTGARRRAFQKGCLVFDARCTEEGNANKSLGASCINTFQRSVRSRWWQHPGGESC